MKLESHIAFLIIIVIIFFYARTRAAVIQQTTRNCLGADSISLFPLVRYKAASVFFNE